MRSIRKYLYWVDRVWMPAFFRIHSHFACHSYSMGVCVLLSISFISSLFAYYYLCNFRAQHHDNEPKVNKTCHAVHLLNKSFQLIFGSLENAVQVHSPISEQMHHHNRSTADAAMQINTNTKTKTKIQFPPNNDFVPGALQRFVSLAPTDFMGTSSFTLTRIHY